MTKTTKTADEKLQRLIDAHDCVICRMDTKDESLDEAIEAVYPFFGDPRFAKQLKRYAIGDRRT